MNCFWECFTPLLPPQEAPSAGSAYGGKSAMEYLDALFPQANSPKSDYSHVLRSFRENLGLNNGYDYRFLRPLQETFDSQLEELRRLKAQEQVVVSSQPEVEVTHPPVVDAERSAPSSHPTDTEVSTATRHEAFRELEKQLARYQTEIAEQANRELAKREARKQGTLAPGFPYPTP
jgi:hypothetical protein